MFEDELLGVYLGARCDGFVGDFQRSAARPPVTPCARTDTSRHTLYLHCHTSAGMRAGLANLFADDDLCDPGGHLYAAGRANENI